MTLSTLLSDRARQNARRICIKFESRKISYSEIDHLVSLGAGGLQEHGLRTRERAAILMDNCPEYIISYFAIIRAGGVAVPINTFLTPDEISYILNDSGCEILLYSERFSSYIDKIKDKVAGLKALTFSDVPGKMTESCNVSENDIAVLLYTSGTTGFPKGAMLTHRNLVSNAEASAKALRVKQRDKFLLFLPLFHAFTFTACVLVPICSGARIILLKSVKPFSNVIKSIIKDRITLFAGVPTVYNILAKKRMPSFMRYLLKFFINIRACISGAAALPEDTVRAFEKRFGVPLIEGYGLTEASPVVAVNPLTGLRKPASVGLPVPGVEVAVIGEERNKISAGEIGELIVKGPNVMKGYFNREEDTREALRDGWLITGDMARIDEDGYIYIVDRKKDIIIVDGMNIYPREVEEFIMQHESVEECAMVGIPDGKGSEITALFLKLRESTHVDESEIRNYFKGKIGRFKIPKKIIFVDELPKTATGKIMKTDLRKWQITR